MTRRAAARMIVALVLLLSVGVASAAPRLDELAWIIGKWKRETARGPAFEEWSRLGARVFEGQGYRVGAEGGARVVTEDMLLVELGGEVFYLPKVEENRYPVPFRLARLDGRHAVFENPDHDSPQVISYELREGGALVVTTEGPGSDGAPRRIEFRFVRD